MYFAFIGHGFGLGVNGPSMLDLQIKTSSTLEEITLIIIGRASGLGLGSILNPLFLKFFDIQLLLTIALAAAAVLEAAIPVNYTVWGVVGTFFANGMCFGVIETCCNLYMVRLWGKHCSTFLQALHFAFGLGAFSAPLVVRPFLLQNLDDEVGRDIKLLWTPSDVRIQYAYYLIALVLGSSSCFFFYVYMFHRKTPAMKDAIDSSTEKSSDTIEAVKPPLKTRLLRHTINFNAALFMLFYCGIEIALGSYLTPFAVKCGLHLDKKSAALMASVYWITFTFSRLVTIFYIHYIGPKNNLIMALVLLSNVFLTPFGDNTEWCLWFRVALNGIGMSSIWAVMFAYIDGYIPLTNSLTSMMVCAACIGECVIPIAVSALIDTDVTVFLCVILACSLIQAMLFVLLMVMLPLYTKWNACHVTL